MNNKQLGFHPSFILIFYPVYPVHPCSFLFLKEYEESR